MADDGRTIIEATETIHLADIDGKTELTPEQVVEAFIEFASFQEMAGGTVLMMRAIFDSTEACDRTIERYDAIEGGDQALARLERYLEQTQ